MRNLNRKNICFKRSISVVFAFIVLMQIFSFCIYAEDGSCGDNLKWSLNNNVLTISGSGAMTDFVDNKFAPWYDNADQIKTVVLPNEISSIGSLAFYGCKNLTSVYIPNSVKSIGNYAFADCTSLITIELPNGIESIGEASFRNCVSLSAVHFPDSLTSIGSMAYYRCSSIPSLMIPASVTYLGTQSFAYCTGLIRATVRANITNLPKWVFYGCEKLSDVILASNIVSADEYSLQGCTSLSGVYTETYDNDISSELRSSIEAGNPDFSNNGFVAPYDPPEISFSKQDNGNTIVTNELHQTNGSVTNVKETIDYTGESSGNDIQVDSVIENQEGWSELENIVSDIKREDDKTNPVNVNVTLPSSEVNGKDLEKFAGKDVILNITTGNGSKWTIDMKDTEPDSFKGSYDLSFDVSSADPNKIKIDSNEVYKLTFSGSTDFNSTVGVKLSLSAANKTATLYQKGMFGYKKIQTVIVDDDGNAWFKLASTDKGTKYYIGIDCEGISRDEAIVPDNMSENFGAPQNGATLLDEDGVHYELTGRTSTWGMSLSTVMIILAVVMVVVIGVVAVIMTMNNKRNLTKEKYLKMIEEESKKD